MNWLKKNGVLIASIIAALPLLAFGGAKLAGVPEVHASFAALGLPAWFGYFIGACEVAGAIALFIKPLRPWAAAGIAIIMLGAIYFHATHTPIAQATPAVILLLLSVFLLSRSRGGRAAAA